MKPADKTAREVRELVPTPLTTVAPTWDSADLSLSAPDTETRAPFPTGLSQVSVGFELGSDAMCKFINNHAGTSILLVPNVLQSPK
jgi:hypothetical protein